MNLSGVDGSEKPTAKVAVDTLGIDGMTHYQYVHFANVKQDYAAVMPEVLCEWERLDKSFDIAYYAHVLMGWDSNPRYKQRHDRQIAGSGYRRHLFFG